MNKLFYMLFLVLGIGSLGFSGCTTKDPAILKVFVRSSTNQLISGARVVIIGDQQSTPATLEHVDTAFTNSSGFATINLDDYFTLAGPDNTTGWFDIIVDYNTKQGTGYSRCRVHTTSVETVYLPN
tara:strand:- start:131 stop:508 length:378 start_codon:yes stop_codon:yes gene_type:complete